MIKKVEGPDPRRAQRQGPMPTGVVAPWDEVPLMGGNLYRGMVQQGAGGLALGAGLGAAGVAGNYLFGDQEVRQGDPVTTMLRTGGLVGIAGALAVPSEAVLSSLSNRIRRRY